MGHPKSPPFGGQKTTEGDEKKSSTTPAAKTVARPLHGTRDRTKERRRKVILRGKLTGRGGKPLYRGIEQEKKKQPPRWNHKPGYVGDITKRATMVERAILPSKTAIHRRANIRDCGALTPKKQYGRKGVPDKSAAPEQKIDDQKRPRRRRIR